MDYDKLNLTELVVLAQQEGFLGAHRGIGRLNLIEYLEGTLDVSAFEPDPLNGEREAMLMLQETWPVVFDQLPCANDHHACWDCPAGRVTNCVVMEWADEIKEFQEDIRKGKERSAKWR